MMNARMDSSVKMEVVNVRQSAAQMTTVRMVKLVKMTGLAPVQMSVVLMTTVMLDSSVTMETVNVLLIAAPMKIASMARSVRMTAPAPAPPSAASPMTARMATSAMSTVTASWRVSVTRTGPVPWLMESAVLPRLVEATPRASIVTRRTNCANQAASTQ